MKMGAFLLGGIMGAAAVVYLNRGKNMSFAGLSSQTTEKVGKMMGSGNKTESFTKSFSKVEEIINKDPVVKQQVDEIMNQNQHKNESYITQ